MSKMKMTLGVFNQPQFSQLILGQISKVRTVLKSSEQEEFKSDLTFCIWLKFEVVISKKQKKRNSKIHPLVSLPLLFTHSLPFLNDFKVDI